VVPFGWLVNVRLEGLKVSVRVGTWPVPDKPADCGLPLPSLVTVRLALRAPAAVGAKATCTEQLVLGFKVLGQLLPVMVKSPGLVPVRARELMATAVLPVLVTVIAWEVLVVPVLTVPKVSDVGERVSVLVGTWPVPDKPADCGLPAPLLVTVRLALRAPAAVGAKAICTAQLAPAFKVAGQLLPVMVKSPGLVPVNAIELMATAVLPVLVTVIA